jgi:hypothetical protein
MSDAKYFVFVADYAAILASHNSALVGVSFVCNPHAGGWHSTSLNNGWFGWENIVHNGVASMPGENNISSRVFHEGTENSGTLTFVIPMQNLVGQPFGDEDTNLVLIAWGNPAITDSIQRAYLATTWPPPTIPVSSKRMVIPLGTPEPFGNDDAMIHWSVSEYLAKNIAYAEYFIVVADYAAMRVANNHGMGGAVLVHNPHTGGWNEAGLNGNWFSWENVVHNGTGTMAGSVSSRVFHEGAANAGTLTFVIPVSQFELEAEDANFVFAVWGEAAMVNAVQRAYLTSHWPLPIIRGDMDGDFRVTSADATMLASHIASGIPVDPRFGDVNCDGVVDLDDVIHLMRALVGQIPTLCPHGGCFRCN